MITQGAMHKSMTRTKPVRRYFKEVRFRQIRALVETARCLSFAGAAKSLGMSTPSVWRQVRALEDEYGVLLVEADGQDLRLTENGKLLAELASPLVEGFDSLKKVFADRCGKVERQLRLVAPTTILNGPLCHAIARYREAFPAVKLRLTDLQIGRAHV